MVQMSKSLQISQTTLEGQDTGVLECFNAFKMVWCFASLSQLPLDMPYLYTKMKQKMKPGGGCRSRIHCWNLEAKYVLQGGMNFPCDPFGWEGLLSTV